MGADQFALDVPMQETADGEGAEGDGGAVSRRQGHPEQVLEPEKADPLSSFYKMYPKFEIAGSNALMTRTHRCVKKYS